LLPLKEHPQEENFMPIFMLKPRPSLLEHPDWIGSERLEYLIIEADNESSARKCASSHAGKAWENDGKLRESGGAWTSESLVMSEHLVSHESYEDCPEHDNATHRLKCILKEGPRF
jgi:hypothetical protein